MAITVPCPNGSKASCAGVGYFKRGVTSTLDHHALHHIKCHEMWQQQPLPSTSRTDYRALFAVVVEWNGRVANQVCTVADDQQKYKQQSTLRSVQHYVVMEGCKGPEGNQADTIVQQGPSKCATTKEMVSASEKAMRLRLDGLTWA